MKKVCPFIIAVYCLLLQACIHEYPHPVSGGGIHNVGEDPTTIGLSVEVTFDLTWQNLVPDIEVSASTKAPYDRRHRFIIEISKDGLPVCHDTRYLSDEEFCLGKMKHDLSVTLSPWHYEITAWYDFLGEDGDFAYDAESLSQIKKLNLSSADASGQQCGFACDFLDLTPYTDNDIRTFTKELELRHCSARFEIVATDVQEFITREKEALNQGDHFTAYVTFLSGTTDTFNAYAGQINLNEPLPEFYGRMRLPFAEYDELVIAQGMIFCDDEENEVSVKLSVENSALITVSATGVFTFPVKRGYITVIKGDFLTSTIEGNISINHIWEGEIIMEI